MSGGFNPPLILSPRSRLAPLASVKRCKKPDRYVFQYWKGDLDPFNAFKRRGMYPNVSKCNAKRYVCCTPLCTKTTITSSVNGRQFSIINNNDLD